MRAAREDWLAQKEEVAIKRETRNVFLSSIHEAGHAIAHELLAGGVEYVTVERKAITLGNAQFICSGFTQPKGRKLSKETIEREAICCLSGPCAEDMVIDEEEESAACGDIDSLKNYMIYVGLTKEEGVQLTERAYRQAHELLQRNWEAVRQISFELMTKGRIDGETVKRIVRDPAISPSP